MLIEKSLEKRSGFTSEIQPTENTNLLLRNNQIPRNFLKPQYNWFYCRFYSIPDGFFRYFINGKGENTELELNYLNALNGLTEYGAVDFVEDTTKYLEHYWYENHDVAYLYNGWLGNSSGLSSDGGTDRTITLIFKAVDADYKGTKILFSQRISSNLGYTIGFTDKRLYVRFYDSANNLLLDTYVYDQDIELNRWYNIVMTHNSNTMDFYVDGVKTKTQTYTGTIAYVNPYLLGNMLAGGYHFQGYMRSFGVYSEYMTDKDIKLFYDTFRLMYSLYPDESKTELVFSQFINDSVLTWNYYFDISAPPPHYIAWAEIVGADNPEIEWMFESEIVELYLMYDTVLGGNVEIYIDKQYVTTVNTSTDNGVKLAYTSGNLGIGIHYIKCISASNYGLYFGIRAVKISYEKIRENIRYLEEDTDQTYWAIEKSFPQLLPRYELDGLNELLLHLYFLFDENDTGLTNQNGAGSVATEILSERKVPKTENVNDYKHVVANFWNGGQYVTNNPPSSDGNTSRTIVFWVRPTSYDVGGGYHDVVSQSSTSTDKGYLFGIDSDANLYVMCFNSSESQLIYDYSSLVLETYKWYCITFTHTSTNYYLYIDGNLEASGSFSGTIDYTANVIKFGASYTANSYQFWGSLSTFFMFKEYWNSTKVNSYFDNSKGFVRMLPEHCFVKTSNPISLDNFKIETTSGNYKNIWLDKGEWYEITFTGIQCTFYGSYTVNGGQGSIYKNGEYEGSINQFNSTPGYDVVYDFIADSFGTYTLKIENQSSFSGMYLYISECVFNYGNNRIHDYSGKNNHAEMIDYTAGSNYVLSGLNDKCFRFLDDTYIKSNLDMYQTLGDKFYIGFWFRPNTRHVSDTIMFIFDTGNHIEATNNELITIKYFQDITNTTDKLILEGDFINQTIDIGEYLALDTWYFVGVIVDDNTSTLYIIIGKQSDNTLLINTNFSFIASTTYQKTNINKAYICGAGGGSQFCQIDLDDLIFEGQTDYTINDIISYFYLEAPTNGGTNQLDGINCNNFDEILENYLDGQHTYILECDYISKIFKLSNNKFLGYGKLIFNYELSFLQTIFDIQTRSSSDAETNSPTWSSWQDIEDSGVINSPNNIYLQFRFSMKLIWFTNLSPKVSKVEIHDYDALPFPRRAFSMPLIYDINTNKKQSVIGLNECITLINTIELNGGNYIEFEFPYNSEKREDIEIEGLIRVYNNLYTVRRISDTREGGKLVTKIYGEASFYNLQYAPPLKEREFIGATPDELINYVLSGTGWELEYNDIYLTRDFSIENNSNCLELLNNIQKLFGGDLLFNNESKKVSLYNDSGVDNGIIFSYEKNIKVNRIVESFDLVNKLYVYGENGINISEHNNGLEYLYIENTGLTEDKCKIINADNFIDTEELFNYALYQKEKYGTPNIIYEIEAKYLEYQNNLENLPNYEVGEIVTVYDKDLGITLQTRIISMAYNILNPMLSSLVLSTQIRTLGDDLTEFMKYKNKLDKVNFRILLLMVRTFLYQVDRWYGFVLKRYVEVTGVVQTIKYGKVQLTNTNEYLNILSSPDPRSQQVTSLRHGKTIKILGETEEFYKIQIILD